MESWILSRDYPEGALLPTRWTATKIPDGVYIATIHCYQSLKPLLMWISRYPAVTMVTQIKLECVCDKDNTASSPGSVMRVGCARETQLCSLYTRPFKRPIPILYSLAQNRNVIKPLVLRSTGGWFVLVEREQLCFGDWYTSISLFGFGSGGFGSSVGQTHSSHSTVCSLAIFSTLCPHTRLLAGLPCAEALENAMHLNRLINCLYRENHSGPSPVLLNTPSSVPWSEPTSMCS
ncbi:hypothetical protein CBL_02336 [Carabus blaptoides fortunei]